MNFIKKIERQFDTKVRIFRSDDAYELGISNEGKKVCATRDDTLD